MLGWLEIVGGLSLTYFVLYQAFKWLFRKAGLA